MKIFVTGSSGYLGSSLIDRHCDKYEFTTFSLFKKSLSDLNLSSIDTVLHCAALVHQKIEHDYENYFHEETVQKNYFDKNIILNWQNNLKS